MSKNNLEILFKWLRTFDSAVNLHNYNDLCDGIMLSQVLNEITPTYFNEERMNKITVNVCDNQRVKVLNLKTLVDEMSDFFLECTDTSLNCIPNVSAIVNNKSIIDMFRLIQLVLVCAVNCPKKEAYIQKIMEMESSVQQVVMEAIQKLMSDNTGSYETLSQLKDEIADLQSKNRDMEKQCHEMKKELDIAKDDVAKLSYDGVFDSNKNLARHSTSLVSPTGLEKSFDLSSDASFSESHMLSPKSNKDVDASVLQSEALSSVASSMKIKQLQDQLAEYRTKYFQAENMQDDLKTKYDEEVMQNTNLRKKCDALAITANEVASIKDELDIAREETASAMKIARNAEQWRKKAEEATSLKQQCQRLQDDNELCMQRISQLEQASRLTSNIKSKAEISKEELAELQSTIQALNQQLEVVESRSINLENQLQIQIKEKERWMNHFVTLKGFCEEVQESLVSVPSLLREEVVRNQLHRLEMHLSKINHQPVSTSPRDSAIAPNFKEEQERVLAQVDPSRAKMATPTSFDAVESSYADCVGDNVENLKSRLAAKELEILKVEQHYRKLLAKAREVIRQLDCRRISGVEDVVRSSSLPSAQEMNSCTNTRQNATTEIENLRELLNQKEKIIEKLERHYEHHRRLKETENRLIVAAWYNFGIRVTQEAMQQRLTQATEKPNSKTESSSSDLLRPHTATLAKQRFFHLGKE